METGVKRKPRAFSGNSRKTASSSRHSSQKDLRQRLKAADLCHAHFSESLGPDCTHRIEKLRVLQQALNVIEPERTSTMEGIEHQPQASPLDLLEGEIGYMQSNLLTVSLSLEGDRTHTLSNVSHNL